ncbi:SMP-30/gluconolactonase/LRE family protein [Chitinophaga silvatica]|nr:SMP-30/gluconolactonase/LRE family protein [Chitinophaga silvatica]
MKHYQATILATLTSELGEGAFWWEERKSWWWVDILGQKIYSKDLAGQLYSYEANRYVTMLVPVVGGKQLLVGTHHGVAFFSPEDGLGEDVTVLDTRINVRCNDGKCDPAGRLWIGTMQMPADSGTGNLYCIDGKSAPEHKLQGVTISNGLVWIGKLMYYIDTDTRKVQEFEYDNETGNITFSRIAVEIPEGYGWPDGMTADSDGNLWIAHWGGFGVYCWNPVTGQLLAKVEVPAPHVSNCVFGGNDLDELLITTAREHMNEELIAKYPLSGSTFRVKLPVKGLLASYFKY